MSTQNLKKDNTQRVYEDLLEHAMHLLNDHQKPVELIAGTMMAIAQRLYKTALNDDEYERIMEVVRYASVKPYKVEKERLH
tara:strand:- start:2009 stop:2251 length:243 start_codon:yes stop_codon:yes gene_type:complete